jgi:ketosteroid isomerase-like protein
MKKSVFGQCFAVLLLFSALVWWASVSISEAAVMGKGGGSAPASLPASLHDPTDRAAIQQIEREMGDAMVAVDIEKLNQIYAEHWATIPSSGKRITKERVLQDFKSGKNKLVSYALGPMDVQVLGNVAVGHGSVSEKRIWDGKDISGEGVWMDLFEKRAGKWVIVRSEGAFVK